LGADAHTTICVTCGGKCCTSGRWGIGLSDATKADMVRVGPKVYGDQGWWREFWYEYFEKPPKRRVVKVAHADPAAEFVDLVCECREYDTETGLCGMYDERPQECRDCPTPEMVEAEKSRAWCPLAAHLWETDGSA